MSRTLHIASFLFLFSLTVGSLQAQDNERLSSSKVGVTTTLRGGFVGVAMPIWLNNRFVLAPGLSFSARLSALPQIRTSLAVTPKYYLRTEKLAPYLSATAGTDLTYSELFTGTVSHFEVKPFAGIALGADYFFDPHISVGVEADLTVPDFDPIQISTGSGLAVSIYF